MIWRDDGKLRSSNLFTEWAFLFSGGLFMLLSLYTDDSGTHDITGQKKGSSAPCWCGYIHTPEYWAAFSPRWKKVLNNFRAPYFHFREFSNKHLYLQPGNAYYGWSERKRHEFLYDLAFQASDSAVPVGGASNAKHLHMTGANAFENSITSFFESSMDELNRHWPEYNGKLLFIFDGCKNRKILVPLHKVHSLFALKDQRIGGLVFEDDTDPIHYPLQAADLLAYSFRQQVERFYTSGTKEFPELRLLDFILTRNMSIKLRRIPKPQWNRLVHLLREDEKRHKKLWTKQGQPPKPYFPYEHFPFEKYGYQHTKPDAV